MRINNATLLPSSILQRYEVYSYNHALEILYQAYSLELQEILQSLEAFEITKDDIEQPGGSESPIPQKFSSVLHPLGWQETKISGDLHIKLTPRRIVDCEQGKSHIAEKIIVNYIDGHNIDFLKGRIACDLEWNSKDQTFDRDLFAFRSFYECDLISAAIIITRSEELNTYFKLLGQQKKYGASTTWMGKLLPRLDSRRQGGCPILAIGIGLGTVSDVIVKKVPGQNT